MFADSGNTSLPAWLYNDTEYFAVEMERVIRPSWQIVCHVSDIPLPGDYHVLDYIGESVIVIRGDDGTIRAFANVCRHRASRLVDGPTGCARKLVCPYHAWTYDNDGRLTGVPMKSDYRALDLDNHGLAPVDIDTWRGFIFVRLAGDGPRVAEMMGHYDAEVAPYRFEDMRAIGRVTLRPRTVNWKNIADNYSDGLHIPVAHPGLTRLFGRDGYRIEASEHVDKMWGVVVDRLSSNPSERAYQALLPRVDHLPEANQRLWLYYKLWPNFAFEIYPDQIDFMQFLPISPTTSLIREISYRLPDDDRREMRAAQYLNWRINRQVNKEDTQIIERVQQGMASPSYTVGPLGESEVCLASFARKLRHLIPEANLPEAPVAGWSHAA
ncbi:Phenylpropionate dioxygenase, large terminal subunit [Sphingomonas laterariae]|uniref:Phenylpropionate dioxygenase, large terminal subunit n=1 Tax=Edaphosphingomonas laterariae TaxID=861865 RepID=A0A239BFM4_9SPHN|nr:aromatic ring-hydroxylating dioxygenase subunit alpha [Sphingomonas laterariae]SNS06730.1 Phenylpropionate dioxygenase, large terminal subunit [Sphingomonas laterariae]